MLKQDLTARITSFVRSVSSLLTFNKKEERISSEPGRKRLLRSGHLSLAQSKLREVAKKALVNWWMANNILAHIDFSEPMTMSTEEWSLFYEALSTRDFSLLEINGVKSIVSRYDLDPASIGTAQRQELERIDTAVGIPKMEDIIDEDDPECFKIVFERRRNWFLPWLERFRWCY